MRRFKGYMTLEAALIMPLVFCVIVLLLYFAYYLYGRCILSQDAYILAFRASVEKNECYKENSKAYVMDKAEEKAGRKYFGSVAPKFDAVPYGSEIEVKGHGVTRHAAMGSYFLKPQNGWDYEGSARAKRRDYSGHIRRCMRLKDIGKEIIRGD